MTQSTKVFSGFASIALVALMVLALPLSFAKADGFDGGDFGGWDTTGFTDYSSPSYDNYGGWDTTGYTDYATPTPYTDTLNYGGYGYNTGGFMTGGLSAGGYMTGGGFNYRTPVITTPSTPIVVPTPVTPSNTTVTTTTNNNTCTNNSCNHDDHSVVNIQNPAPVINNNNVVANYTQPTATSYSTQQYCAAGYYGTYPNCYRGVQPAPVQPYVAYNQTPYIALSQAPYTGLDLGFWGTLAYWGFMVAFALFAAYLIAVKRVQNSIANWMKEFLFGTEEVEATAAYRPMTYTSVVTAPAAPAPRNEDAIDPFILSQINRRTA